ncbi:Os09g0400600 [Oryza sativa Japonica Group]|uniref:Os09g0400600 protein n=1 Tax=Oryza sativa subsp. japonica TaxID=39947 RepID=Q6ERV7_ORYSJ|nr:unknown protein [Oryza sativa Japonica Group]BAD28613.1 unknown protein [Oryza sativa Japonica Group]BAF25031.1 Os09g0400600 [Oryza sativa Japonica Group]|eukprot:NP_001063117.1 Os09g0400600 [Oryza sativa Japonica Group]
MIKSRTTARKHPRIVLLRYKQAKALNHADRHHSKQHVSMDRHQVLTLRSHKKKKDHHRSITPRPGWRRRRGGAGRATGMPGASSPGSGRRRPAASPAAAA